uniref:Splicing factor Cactin n=1 Tax=Chromera velia CCMP2878 TaxID=1169474 RepID=A0A0G4GXL7_9ALVE|eukprot:Cvel_793.t1-p1 / transcript=Cvel_793.t1 / gene=Cvel_793 / organism=Chromera_velia_CCMP2878 / gene_product=Cactin, putative / transcript_product=Cactin, putative / location=Cvel_scaffold24:164169-172301(+) / protein_length=738 / sequence_SO=supercontig / SO=protein_coding / is_pseudo=false
MSSRRDRSRSRSPPGKDQKALGPKAATKLMSKVLGEKLGYTSEKNPFGDDSIARPFVWKKKQDYQLARGEIEREDTRVTREKLMETTEKQLAEIRRVKDRREQREKEEKELEEQRAALAREREQENFEEWAEKEKRFQLEQAHLRSKIRMRQGREKPIDHIAKAVMIVHWDPLEKDEKKEEEREKRGKGEEEEEEEKADVEAILRNIEFLPAAHSIFENMNAQEIGECVSEARSLMQASIGTEPKIFWKCFIMVGKTVCSSRKRQEQSEAAGGISAFMHQRALRDLNDLPEDIAQAVEKMLSNKSIAELSEIESKVDDKLRAVGNTQTDASYWESIKKKIPFFKARWEVERVYQAAQKKVAEWRENEIRKEKEEKLRKERERGLLQLPARLGGPSRWDRQPQGEEAGGGQGQGRWDQKEEEEEEERETEGVRREVAEDAENGMSDGSGGDYSPVLRPFPEDEAGAAGEKGGVARMDDDALDLGSLYGDAEEEGEGTGQVGVVAGGDGGELETCGLSPKLKPLETPVPVGVSVMGADEEAFGRAQAIKQVIREVVDRRQRAEKMQRDAAAGGEQQTADQRFDAFIRKEKSGMERDEEVMDSGDVEPAASSNRPTKYEWEDKYKPRKPRFFNRVKTGFEWNKYNQTHYDHDNPPPKTVQGYKFNIFYPDLIDNTKAPKYVLEASDTEGTVILRFVAGPPYEDVAFKILNREWDKKFGFRCVFDRGIMQLYFNFRRYRYRK